MRARVSGLVEALATDARSDVDAATARHQLQGYRAAMDVGRGPLCFGRIDTDDRETWYVGRRHVEDERGAPVVVDWRAGIAIPFYRATFRDPLGLHGRRRFVLEGRELVSLFEEDFDDPDSAHHATGVADPLLAELDRARTGEMRDIVATIQAEQDVVIRAPLDQLLVVQGGPGHGQDRRRPPPRRAAPLRPSRGARARRRARRRAEPAVPPLHRPGAALAGRGGGRADDAGRPRRGRCRRSRTRTPRPP